LHPSKWAAAVRFDVFECRVVRRATDVCTESDGFGRVVVGGVDEHLSEWVVPLLQSVDDPFEVVRFVGIGHDQRSGFRICGHFVDERTPMGHVLVLIEAWDNGHVHIAGDEFGTGLVPSEKI
jgi:hypothetical protein